MIEQATFRPYRLELRGDWTGRGAGSWREGWIVALKSGECRGFGDCAPLPAAGTEQPEEVAAVLGAVIDAIRGRTAGRCSDLIQTLTGTPALRCGLETGLLDLIGRCTNQPVYRLLGAAAPPVVHVNALIGMLDAGAVQRATRAQAQGYRVLKIKMGALPPDLEIRRLRNLSARLPAGISLRLDANRAWNLPTIRYMFEALRNLPVESIEEPLHFPSPGRISRLQRTSPWPVALDESLARGGAGEYLSRPTVARVVLKPMVLGGPVAAMALARRARQQGMRAVVTTTLDSAVGRFAALHLAAAVDSGLAHGLATGGWLRTDLATGPSTRFGRMPLSSVPGLGIEMRDPGGWDRPAFFAGTPTREIQ
ncbi:MAG: enolase C-terminal domain-like protein [Pseudomonadota bacterium]|nr:enolase C-terminal domain-like protein [Pseudomonadota bacterium]